MLGATVLEQSKPIAALPSILTGAAGIAASVYACAYSCFLNPEHIKVAAWSPKFCASAKFALSALYLIEGVMSETMGVPNRANFAWAGGFLGLGATMTAVGEVYKRVWTSRS